MIRAASLLLVAMICLQPVPLDLMTIRLRLHEDLDFGILLAALGTSLRVLGETFVEIRLVHLLLAVDHPLRLHARHVESLLCRLLE